MAVRQFFNTTLVSVRTSQDFSGSNFALGAYLQKVHFRDSQVDNADLWQPEPQFRKRSMAVNFTLSHFWIECRRSETRYSHPRLGWSAKLHFPQVVGQTAVRKRVGLRRSFVLM